jgi:hypothetical protein
MKTVQPVKLFLLTAALLSGCRKAPHEATSVPPPLPSLTETSSATPGPPTCTATFVPTWTLDATQEFDLTSQAGLAPFTEVCGHMPYSWDMSSDGNWAVCDSSPGIHVVSRNGADWEFSYDEFFGTEFYGFTYIAAWTLDGRYLFFGPMATIDGIYPFPDNAMALLRMDLQTGQVQTILSGNRDYDQPRFYALSVSPTGRRVAYIFYENYLAPIDIQILDLRTGEAQVISLDPLYSDGGWFSWSDDGIELTLSVFDRGSSQHYHLTYDMLTLNLIDSQAYVPPWISEITAEHRQTDASPTP